MLDFIKESLKIEGIHRDPSQAEVDEYLRFMALKKVDISDMIHFVNVYQPGAELRDRPFMDVYIAGFLAPRGCITVKTRLMDILSDAYDAKKNKWHVDDAYTIHCRYEKLHPFMDGNGRSGRMLWMWMMKGEAPLGFLHTWYYQSLLHADRKRV